MESMKSGKEKRKDIKKDALNSVKNMNEAIQKKANEVKASADHATKKVNDAIIDANRKRKV